MWRSELDDDDVCLCNSPVYFELFILFSMVFVYVYVPVSVSISAYRLVDMCVQMSSIHKRVLYFLELEL